MQELSFSPQVCCWQSTSRGAQHPVNSYLLQTAQGEILIDPAEDFPRDPSPGAILVTHVQQEHITGAAHFPKVPLYVPAGDEYLCEGRAAYEKLITPWPAPWDWTNRGNFRGHLAGARNERPPESALPVAGVLCDGDRLHSLKVLATPGHGKSAVTYLIDDENQLIAFCGDLVCGDGMLWNWFDCDWDYGLQTGQKTLLASARRLLEQKPDVLLPSHGEPIYDAQNALRKLIENLERVLLEPPDVMPLNFPDNSAPIQGWRKLADHLYQWKDGNCTLITSRDSVGLLVDDGLCHWLGLEDRAAHHRAVMTQIKSALGLSRIEAVVITHYHGDHIYNIPFLLEDEPHAQVVTLDIIAPLIESIESSKQFNLAAPLWWYDANHDHVPVSCTVKNNEVFRWREYDLKFFHLGGQTFYHCGVSTTVDGARVCFVGDAIYGWGEECEPVLCFNDAEPETRGWLYAVNRLIAEQPNLLVCGHGSALREPMPLLQIKRRNWRRRLSDFDALDFRKNRRAFFDPG